MKMYAVIKADNPKAVKKFLVAFLTEESAKNRKVNKDNEEDTITLELEFENTVPFNIVNTMGKCGIISIHYDGVESNAELTVEETESMETEQTENSEEKSEKVWGIESFPELKDIIDSAKSDEDLAQKVAEHFKMRQHKEAFVKMLLDNLKETDGYVKNEPEEISNSQRTYISQKINRFLANNYGYKVRNKTLMKVITLIKDYYLSIPKEKKVKLECMPWLDLSDIDPTDTDNKKIDMILKKIDKNSLLSTYTENQIYLILVNTKISNMENKVYTMDSRLRMLLSELINNYSKDYTDESIKVFEFLRDIKAIL